MRRKRSRLVVVIALITVLFFCLDTVSVSAASLSEVRKNIKEKQQELEAQKKEEGSLSEQAESLEKQIIEKESNIAELESAISEAEDELTQLESELEKAQEKIDAQGSDLNSRLRNMYKSGTVGFLDVLLGSDSFSEFLTNLDMVQMVYSNDQDVLSSLKDAYEEIDQKKQEIESLSSELEESKAYAEKEKSSIEADKAEVDSKKQAVASDAAASQEELEKLEAYSKYLETLIQSEGSSTSSSSSSSSSSGSSGSSSSGSSGGSTVNSNGWVFPAPSYTRVSSHYGYRSSGFHGGVDLAAPGGSPILAVQSGTVLVATYHYSYGNYVIVDHGNGITTLYAHASSLLVKKGQTVSKGQQIAKVGTTGNSTGNHLHFEVRINGVRTNPEPYIGL